MRCLGSATHLKNSIGNEYKIDVSVAHGTDASKVDATVKEAIPGAVLVSSFADSRTYKVQRSAVSIADVWAKMEARDESAGILDWGVRQTSLEEVRPPRTSNRRLLRLCLTVPHSTRAVKGLPQNRRRGRVNGRAAPPHTCRMLGRASG